MEIAFVKVRNSMNFRMSHFDDLFSDEVMEELGKLRKDEYRIYDMSTYNGSDIVNITDFVNDFNDGEIGESWWCFMMPLL